MCVCCQASYAARHRVDAPLNVLDFTPNQLAAISPGLTKRVRHLNYTLTNERERWFVAQRYFAAATARNNILLHLDDDLGKSSKHAAGSTQAHFLPILLLTSLLPLP